MAADPLASLAAEVLSTDNELRRRIAGFVSNVLDEAEWMLENGNQKAKSDLINKLVPALVRQMSEQAEDEALVKMRAELTDFYAEMRGIGPTDPQPASQPDIPVDEPPVTESPIIAPPTTPTAIRVRVSKKPST